MAGAEDSGGNMVILTSVGASVGVLPVVAAALTVVLCVWQCSRRRSKCFSEVLHEGMMPGTDLFEWQVHIVSNTIFSCSFTVSS